MSIRRALFLRLQVHVRDERHHLRLPLLPIALYVLPNLLLSVDCILALIPGEVGRKVRMIMDSALCLFWGMMRQGPNEYVNVHITSAEKFVKVRLRTF